MALNLNDLTMTPRVGAYVYMPNTPQPHNCVVSPNQETPLKAGDIVTLDATVQNPHCPVIKKAGVTDAVFGVIPFDVRKNAYSAKEKVHVAVEGSYLYFQAAGTINQGAKLYFTSGGKVTSTATAGNSIVGIANTYAGAENDLIQVKLKFETTSSSSDVDLSAYLTSATAASTYLSQTDAASTYLTKADAGTTYVPQTRKINDKPLSDDVTLTASDVGAEPAQQ